MRRGSGVTNGAATLPSSRYHSLLALHLPLQRWHIEKRPSMLRLLVNGLLLSSVRRSTVAACGRPQLALRSILFPSFASTCSMEKPFEQMAKQGVPSCNEPTPAAAPAKEAQAVPKLSAQEFRVYNRMAEHMDMFVRHITYPRLPCNH